MSEILVIVDSAAKGVVLNEYFAGRAEIVLCQTPPLQPVHKMDGGNSTETSFTFKELPAGQEVISKIRQFIDREIYLALENDSKSEYCAWLLSAYAQQTAKSRILVRRLHLHGLTKDEIDKSLKQVSAVDERRGIDFYVRALFDIYLGRHLTRLIGTKNGPGNLPLNFNSLCTLFFLGEREAEIKMFAPPEKWQVMADLRLDGQIFPARLEGAADLTTDGFFKELAGAEKAVQLVREDKFMVDVVDRQELLVPPPTPYNLAELLHDAFVLCGSQPGETMRVVAKLFYGVEVEGRVTGLISSFYDIENFVVDDWQSPLRAQVKAMLGADALGDGLAEPDIKTGMIYPLRPELGSADLAAVLTPMEGKVYDLLRCRALASQMRPASGENIRVEITAGPESLFLSKFHNVTSRGFMEMFQGSMDKDFSEPCPLAGIAAGAETVMLRVMPEKTVSTPVAYTIDTLFADLAEFSVKVEPLNILILQKMIDAGYLKISAAGYWRPTDKNKQVETIMKRAFPGMQGINLSAYIAQTIAEVTSGRKGLAFALKQFDQTLMGHGKSLVKAKVKLSAQLRSRKRTAGSIIKQRQGQEPERADEETLRPVETPVSAEDESSATVSPEASPPSTVLPVEVAHDEAGEPEVAAVPVDTGAEDAAETAEEQPTEAAPSAEEIAETVELSVAEEPETGQETTADTWSGELQTVFEQAMAGTPGADILPAAEVDAGVEVLDSDQDKQCQVCGKPMLLKKDRFGKFWSCSAFPECRHSEAYSESEVLKILCPLCGEAKVIEKRTPTGKIMYVCPAVDCEFMAWSRPYNIPCQVCDSSYLVEKKSPTGAIDLRCPRAGCNYKLPLPGSEKPAPPAAAGQKKKKVRVRRVPKGSASGKKVRVVRRKK